MADKRPDVWGEREAGEWLMQRTGRSNDRDPRAGRPSAANLAIRLTCVGSLQHAMSTPNQLKSSMFAMIGVDALKQARR